MRYFRPAIITLVIAVVLIFALLFYVSIKNGDISFLPKKSNDDVEVKTAHVTEAQTEPKTEADDVDVTEPAELTTVAPTTQATTENITVDGVTPPESVLQAPIKMLATGDSLRVRTKPDTSGEVLGHLNTNDEVMKYGATGEWTYVKYGNSFGWVSSQYLKPAQ